SETRRSHRAQHSFHTRRSSDLPTTTNSLLYLENLPKHSSVKLYNLNGRLLLQEAFKEQKASLDLSELSKGVYLLELQNNGERVLDRKSTRLNSSHVKRSYADFC